jgi:hypothetical protein
MKLPKDKSVSNEHALSFATQVSERHALKGLGDSSARTVAWLQPRRRQEGIHPASGVGDLRYHIAAGAGDPCSEDVAF